MSDNGLREGPQAPRERSGASAPGRGPDERAPLFGRWWPWYLLVALDLAAVIAFCGAITHAPR